MALKERFLTGLYLAVNSFSLLWRYPILFLYLFFGSLFTGGLGLIKIKFISPEQPFVFVTPSSIFGLFDTIKTALSAVGFLRYLILLLFNITSIFIISFFTVAVMYHTRHILHKYGSITFKKGLLFATTKIKIIAIWSLLSTAVTAILQLLAEFIPTIAQHSLKAALLNPIFLITIILSIGWGLLTLFVLPIITVEHLNIVKTIYQSIKIISQMFIEIIGGEFWIGLVWFFILVPINVASILLYSPFGIPGFYIQGAIALLSILGMIITIIISTIHAIFKLSLYHYYKLPEEELTELRYPRF